MSDFKLTIDLLPKGAWGNDLSKTLPKKDWDILRKVAYERANHKCEICGYETDDLDAHEVWEFDIKEKTQTLKEIVAICSRCHGIKHFKNTVRLGKEQTAISHSLKVNNCSEQDFVQHLTKAVMDYKEKNKVFRWKMIVNFEKFGGEGISFKQREIPFIKNPYEKLEWLKTTYGEIKKQFSIEKLKDNLIGVPKITSITVDNYQGEITLTTVDLNKVEWFLDNKKIKTNYMVSGTSIVKFSVQGLEGKFLHFKLTNENGSLTSKDFKLYKYDL